MTILSSACLSFSGFSSSFDNLDEVDVWGGMARSGWASTPVAKSGQQLAAHFPKQTSRTISRKVKANSQAVETPKRNVPFENFESFSSEVGSLLGYKTSTKPTTQHKIKVVASAKSKKLPAKQKKPDSDMVKAQTLLSELRNVRLQLTASRESIPTEQAQEHAVLKTSVSNHYLDQSRSEVVASGEAPAVPGQINEPAATEVVGISEASPYAAVESLEQAYKRFRKEQGLPEVPRIVGRDSEPKSDSMSSSEALAMQDKAEAPAGVVSSPSQSIASTQAVSKTERQTFDRTSDELLQVEMDLLIVDERSAEEADILYPVAGLSVNVNGTNISGTTDTLGRVQLAGLADRSRYLVKITDAEGRIYPSLYELNLDDGAPSQSLTIKVLRKFSLENVANTASTQQRADKGSLCGVAKEGDYPASGIQVSVTSGFEGPFYFNEFGLVDPTLQATTENGQFCLLNVNPGITVMRFSTNGQKLFEIPYTYSSGWHKEDSFDIAGVGNLGVRLGVVAPAHDQLSANPEVANSRIASDFAKVVPLGEEAELTPAGSGSLQSSKNLMLKNQRLWFYSYGPEFETVIQSQDMTDSSVLTLVPRGFMEDLALKAEVPFDHNLGHVYAEFGHWSDMSDDVEVELVDISGQVVTKGWYYAGSPVTKTIFNNLNAGEYSLIVKSIDGSVLSADTVYVYDKATTFVSVGNRPTAL